MLSRRPSNFMAATFPKVLQRTRSEMLYKHAGDMEKVR
jgi:hypothetical protein